MEIVEDVEVKTPAEPTGSDDSKENPIACKVRGAELFKQGDVDGAIDVWFSGLRALQFILSKKPDFERDASSAAVFIRKWEIYVGTFVDLSTNMALALLKKGHYRDAIKYCHQALKYDKSNLKAYLRISQAHAENGEYGVAIDYCNEALRFYPDNLELRLQKKKMIEQSKEHDRSQKVVLQKVFEQLEHDPRSQGGIIATMLPYRIIKSVKSLWTRFSSIFKFVGTAFKFFYNKHVAST
ncbi:tetratricopeptide repeat domain containing protein [Babesia bovis T2Bo]|uniref:peptidylprolyl isomerase n=1 Tax=Babesia bovis TaxID=5865 RepID=A7AQR3_BABBO|nr:tetratricopeptide repeat domain containing protein [Babesia bovis T2Bo]EDO06882.1 tetratricopeptide repeat domain containing protein [Babesia bovis T2Bo]|eukprot:XP_001610450.1 tetratricopeptide repeat containing domain protein [Babesia bovis T2Bo]